jgi:hypothetical protein
MPGTLEPPIILIVTRHPKRGKPMSDAATPDSSVFIVTIRRSVNSEPECYYMPALTPSIAALRVRCLAKAPDALVLSIHANQSKPH